MSTLTIISGSPATGKTTLARALAGLQSNGLHFHTDVFYDFPVHLIDPADPASRHQNTVIMRAIGRAASVFIEGGYAVYLDGVVGPWFLGTLLGECKTVASFDYVLLISSLDEALQRASDRADGTSLESVRHMHRSFAAAEEYRAHQLDTSGLTPLAVLECYETARATGVFRVSG